MQGMERLDRSDEENLQVFRQMIKNVVTWDRLSGRSHGSDPALLFELLDISDEIGIELDHAQLQALMSSNGRSPETPDEFCPPFIAQSITQLLQNRRIESLLDPWAGWGSLISPVTNVIHPLTAVGIEWNESRLQLASRLDRSGSINWSQANPIKVLPTMKASFDAIVSFPPFGLRSNENVPSLKAPGAELAHSVKDDLGNALVLMASALLTDDGIGCFVVPPNFTLRAGSSSAFHLLQTFGLHLNAYFSIPSRSLLGTPLAAALIVIERKAKDRVFVGRLNPESDAGQQLAVTNFLTATPTEDLASGIEIDRSEFLSFDRIESGQRTRKLASVTQLQGVPLASIVSDINVTKASVQPGFKELSNVVFVPNIGHSDAVTSTGLMKLKPHNYFQLVLRDQSTVDAEYLAAFFNSPLGQLVRDGAITGAVIPKLNRQILHQSDVYIPSSTIQQSALEADASLRRLSNEISELQQELWLDPSKATEINTQIPTINNADGFIDWIDTLPFPLASALWAYHAAGENDQVQYQYLDKFFQALAGFQAIVFLSAFSSDEESFEEYRLKITDELERLSNGVNYGDWVSIAAYLAKETRTLLNTKPNEGEDLLCFRLFRTRDTSLLEAISSTELVVVLQKAVALRNNLAHGGVVGDAEAARLRTTFEGWLETVRKVYGRMWSRYQLIQPTDAMPFRGGVFELVAELIAGPRTPFERRTYAVAQALNRDQLHLIDPMSEEALPLVPLMRIMASPKTAQNACYFFNRSRHDGVRFVSYHFEPEPQVTILAGDAIHTGTVDAIYDLLGTDV